MTRLRGWPLPAVRILVLMVVTLWPGRAFCEDPYAVLLAAMLQDQPQLESLLQDPGRCLGERLDGMLHVKEGCPDWVRDLGERENRNRHDLNQLMAADLGLSAEEVGRQWAIRKNSRYRRGVLREVRLSTAETAWWDGILPPPGLVPRVLTRENAKLYRQADTSQLAREALEQYESFYVVDRVKNAAGESWYAVSEEYVPRFKPINWSPKIAGWIAEKDVIPWRWALAMQFASPVNREPSLFFRTMPPLIALGKLDAGQRAERLKALRTQLGQAAGKPLDVIAEEPHVGVEQECMVVYPVLDSYPSRNNESFPISSMATRLLEVSARTRSEGEKTAADRPLVADILFVMDTTESMQPYLDNVLQATKEFVAVSGGENIHFGFIGYRDKNPAFGYVTKHYTTATLPAKDFLPILATVKAQSPIVKGDDIPECVYQGLAAALDSVQWRANVVRIIFLVGDAPGRDEDGLNAVILRDRARLRKIGIMAFQLRNSTVSREYDGQTARQFETVSTTLESNDQPSLGSKHFFSVDTRAHDFAVTVAQRFQEALAAIRQFPELKAKGVTPKAEPGTLTELIFQQAALLLADPSLPEKDLTGWVCDKVLTEPTKPALVPKILVTEGELDELESRVRELRDLGMKVLSGEEHSRLDFFDLVAKNSQGTILDPKAVNFRDAFSMPLGIEQLPYDSAILSKNREDFRNPAMVHDLIVAMDNKLACYVDLKKKRANKEVWKKLSQGTSDKDRVVALPLDQLP